MKMAKTKSSGAEAHPGGAQGTVKGADSCGVGLAPACQPGRPGPEHNLLQVSPTESGKVVLLHASQANKDRRMLLQCHGQERCYGS